MRTYAETLGLVINELKRKGCRGVIETPGGLEFINDECKRNATSWLLIDGLANTNIDGIKRFVLSEIRDSKKQEPKYAKYDGTIESEFT